MHIKATSQTMGTPQIMGWTGLRRPDQSLPGGELHLPCIAELQTTSWFVRLQETIDVVTLARTMTMHEMP